MSGTAVAALVAAASVAVSTIPRALLAADMLPAALRPFVWSDVLATYADRLAGGRLPYVDTFFDYPPGIGYVAGSLSVLSGGALAYVLLWAALVAVAAATVGVLLARDASPGRAILFWSASPQLLLYSGSNFDVLPVALVVGAVVAARRSRTHVAAALLALGTITKLFPALVAGVLFERVRRAGGGRAALAVLALFASSAAVVAIPSVLLPHPSTEGVLHQAARTNFDSVWGLTLAGLGAAGVDGTALVGALSVAGLALTYLAVVRRADAASDPARVALLALLALLLWTRLYSPQYSLWVLPLFALTRLPRRPYLLLCAADLLVFASVFPLTLVRWGATDAAATALLGVLAAGVVLRHVALIAAWRDPLARSRQPATRTAAVA